MGCQKHQNYQQHDNTPINTQMYEKGSGIRKKNQKEASTLWQLTVYYGK